MSFSFVGPSDRSPFSSTKLPSSSINTIWPSGVTFIRPLFTRPSVISLKLALSIINPFIFLTLFAMCLPSIIVLFSVPCVKDILIISLILKLVPRAVISVGTSDTPSRDLTKVSVNSSIVSAISAVVLLPSSIFTPRSSALIVSWNSFLLNMIASLDALDNAT